jgi:FtsZ-interacting cell division protein ZipA
MKEISFDQENAALMRNPAFRAMLERAQRQVEETGGIPLDEMRRRFGLSERRPANRE